MFATESAATHSNDLIEVLQPVITAEKKKGVVLVDNGPDWCKHSIKTLHAMGQVWDKLELDYLLITSYAPGDSKFNPIEHAWAPLTMWCFGLVLHNTLEGEDLCPNRQTTLSEDERYQKNICVFDAALSKVASVLGGRHYDGYPVSVRPVSTHNEENSIPDKLAHISSRKVVNEASPHLKDAIYKCRLYARHCRQGTYTLEFTRCSQSLCGHCSHAPVTAQKSVEYYFCLEF